ncbi:TauD/TfdA family dioxygenase [Streptomyces sp. SID3343]|uniref:TauD/TfdA family dioxygenase n=1 Tax=Streptomyces sp. SID3343 TaxID=2690260 RepID=UPI00136B4DCB|nr:hypothetical protein [Streptomyces sp. SID3343]
MAEEAVAAERLHLWDRATLEEDAWLIHPPSSWPATESGVTGRLRSALSDGPGLVVLRGLPLAGLSDQAGADLCRSVVSLAGTPRPHESTAPLDHLLTSARPNRGPAPGDPDGASVKAVALASHTDRAGPPRPPRVLALLCVRPAPTGGESLLVSGHTVHDRLAADRPEVLPTLYRDFHFGAERHLARTGPVFFRADGRLDVQYNRYQIERGHDAAGEPLTPAQVEALDAVDEVLDDESLFLRLALRRGDLLMLNNYTVLHGRTSFVDHHDPLRRRCLARAWAD